MTLLLGLIASFSACGKHKNTALVGSGKVRYSDEVQPKNTSCFPGKAARKKVPVCSLSAEQVQAEGRSSPWRVSPLTPPPPVAEHADLWKQSPTANSKWSHHARWDYWTDQNSCFGVFSLSWCSQTWTVRGSAKSLWGLRVKIIPREGLKTLSQTPSLSAPW